MNKLFYSFFIFFIFTNLSLGSPKQKVIENFEKISNFSFKFKQTVNDKEENGNCIIKYPKKIYCTYDDMFNKILVSNGKSLVIKTDKNNQYYRYSLKDTPLNFILDKSFLIKKIKELDVNLIDDKYLNFSIINENNFINIYFDKNNYNLIGWQTEDVYQNLVITFIYNMKKNLKVDDKLFKLPKQH